jgi:putative sporulation protein YyaC
MHPNSITIAIDAAIGDEDDIGLIKIIDKGLKPGLGVDKNLGIVGDLSIIGIVASKSLQNYNLFNATRLNLIYKMAEQISSGIEKYISFLENKNATNTQSFGA